MTRDRQPAGECPKCQGLNFFCMHNHFERDDLVIDSWEHRCTDCGHRITRGYRSDDPPEDLEGIDPHVCPWCSRSGAFQPPQS